MPLPDHRGPDADKATTTKLADKKTLAKAVDLFRHGRYQASLEAFDTLEIDNPDDARVWYYAALSYGLSTGDWNEGAARLVEKGIAREEAGTPQTSRIDVEFRDLTSANGKDWLATYRKRVKSQGKPEMASGLCGSWPRPISSPRA